MARGILLDDDDDLKIAGGTLAVGERRMQDAYIVLSVGRGEIKEDPIAGADLDLLIRGKASREKIRKTIEIALRRVAIDPEEIKDEIAIRINKKTL